MKSIWIGTFLLLVFNVNLMSINNVKSIDEVEDVSFVNAIIEISQRFNVFFTFDLELVEGIVVDGSFREFDEVENAVEFLLFNTDLKYRIIDQQYVVIYKNNREGIESLKEISKNIDGLIYESEMELDENRNIRIVPKLTPFRKPMPRIAFSVEGIVVDQNNEPLIGVNIQVKNSSKGTTTDVDGEFVLEEVDENTILIISYVGYETQEVEIKGKSRLEIILLADSQLIDEVVVVGFGSQKRSDLIGAVTTVSPADLKIPASNLTTALAGRVSGMIAFQRSGEPGMDDADFFIRGVTTFGYKKDPLILIDNVEVSSTELARLQTDDIATFSIMKDATATAIYGARGANGVILITTKEGTEGKVKVDLRVENNISTPTRDVELADGVEYMKLHNKAVRTRNPLGHTIYSEEKIKNTGSGRNSLVYPNNDWRNELIKNYAVNQRYNLNVSGGGKVARYYVAGAMTKDHGVLKVDKRNNFNNNINLTSYNLRSNINVNLTNSTELIIRMNGNFDDYVGPISGGKATYNMIMSSNPVLFPAYFPIDEKHQHVKHIMFGNFEEGNYTNPYAELMKGYKEYSRSYVLAQLELKQNLSFIADGLSFRSLMNTNRSGYFDVVRNYNPFYYGIDSYDRKSDDLNITLLNETQGTEYLGYSEGPKELSSSFYLETALNYNKRISNEHNISSMLVYIMRNSISANAGNLQLSLPHRNLGLSGRTTYSYKDKYFTEFNFGYNGSERFYKNHRFGFFPSFGVAWSISNEEFFEPLGKYFSKLRLRGTYGFVGNDAIGSPSDRFFYLSEINMNAGGATFGKDNGYSRTGVSTNRYANENITWEKAEKYNFAIEAGFFDKLDILIDIYKENRSNILMTRANIPSTMGLASPIRANVGEATGRGIDISYDFSHSWMSGFWIQSLGNYTFSQSAYKYFEEPEYDEWWASRVGYSIHQEWGYIAERLFVDEEEVANSPQQNFGEYMAGDIKYRDVNGDGQVTELDMVPIGFPTIPEIVYGFGLSCGYSNFDFSMFFQGLARESFRIGVAETSPFIGENQLLKVYAENHWSEENKDLFALWPRLSTTTILNNRQRSTWFLRDGSFLRLKQLEIGYNIPSSKLEKLKLNNMRVYFNGANLFLWSKFKLWDVEMASNGLGYPIQRVFNLGLNVSF